MDIDHSPPATTVNGRGGGVFCLYHIHSPRTDYVDSPIRYIHYYRFTP